MIGTVILIALGLTTRTTWNKDATRAPGLTTRSKDATRSKGHRY